MADSSVWVPHPEFVWVPGKPKGGTTYETDFGDVSLAAPQDLEPLGGTQVLEGVDDCCSLSNVTPGAILHTVRKRYEEGTIYTNVSNVLIAVNPFRPLDIYSTGYLERYRGAKDVSTQEPHIFGLCSQAWSGLMAGVRSQSVLISGESGAGKTETTKLVLFYTSAALAGQDGGLEDTLMEINPILEAFGNARTVRNNNSSRFGKWIEVQVNPATRILDGVTVIDYLLEVTRVCGQGPGERNYHIFYQLAKDEEMSEKLQLKDAAQANYLKANSLDADGVDDQSDLSNLRKALATLDFDTEEETAIFEIVGAILHIGNLDFDAASADEAKISTPESLASASALLRVDKEALSKAVCFKRVSTAQEVVMSPLDAHKARQARDAVAKLLYGRLFTWIVFKCNEALGQGLSRARGGSASAGGAGGDAAQKAGLFLGVLDIAGFESFEKNMFEQLLINLSNEKLQQFFNQTVFKAELEEYSKEGVPVSAINFVDNADVLDLIEKTGDGLLAILDDCTNGVRQTDANFTEKLCKAKAGQARFLKPKFSGKNLFGINHYAGEVWYTTDGFLEKNVASVPPEVLELMRTSEHEVLQSMGNAEEAGAGPPKAGGAAKKKATVGLSFKRSLQQLMDKLNTSECNFVRCIKPNQDKVPMKFSSPMVMDQLRLCGVMETVKIRKMGYASRMPYAEFAARYLCIVPPDARKALLKEAGSSQDWRVSAEADMKKVAAAILEKVGAEQGATALGNTKLFLKANVHHDCEERRKEALAPVCTKIQGHWRGHEVRLHMKEVFELHKQFITLMKEAGHELHAKDFEPRPLRGPNQALQALNEFDALVLRASELPVKIGYLHQATKVRAHIAAEVEVAEQVAHLKDSSNLIELQALVGQIANYKFTGPEVDALAARVEVLKKEMSLKRKLVDATTVESEEDLQAALSEAERENLGDESRWLMRDGAEALKEAKAKFETLYDAKRRAEENEKGAAGSLEDALNSNDALKIQEAMELAAANGVKIDPEKEKAMKALVAERQQFLELDLELQRCIAEGEAPAIEASLEKIRTVAGPDRKNWPVPQMPAHIAAAQARIAELGAGKAVEGIKDKYLQAAVKQVLDRSFDVPAMQSLVQRYERQLPPEATAALKQRIETVQAQTKLRRRLLNCAVSDDVDDVAAALREVESAGLGHEGANWMLPDGPRLVGAVRHHAAGLRDINTVKERIAAAAKVFDYDDLTGAIAAAKALGITPSEYISAEKVRARMQKAENVQKYMKEQAENPKAMANLQLQLDRLNGVAPPAPASDKTLLGLVRNLAVSTDISAIQGALIRAEREGLKDADKELQTLRKRVQTLQTQGPHLRALRNVLFEDREEAVKAVVDAACGAGLDQPGAWLMPDGPKAFASAAEQLRTFERQREAKALAMKEVPEACRNLMDSLDLSAIRSLLDRAESAKVKCPEVDAIRARAEKLETQLRLLRQLRNCTVFDTAWEVERCLRLAKEQKLDDPAQWMLPDGPAVMEAVEKHLASITEGKTREELEKADIISRLKLLREGIDTLEVQQVLARAHVAGIQDVIVSELENRVKSLQEQQVLIRELKNCLVFEDASDVQMTLEKVRTAGLGAQDGWLLPQGPELYSSALARMIHCDKCQAVLDGILEAAGLCDAEELEMKLLQAQDLGVPERKYSDAYELFVLMQNADYVESLLQQLRDEKDPDPEDFKRMANLASQLEFLGVKKEASSLKDVASRMARGRSTAVFKSTNEGERYLARLVFEDFQNFSKLKDPMMWNGGQQAGGVDPAARGQAMLSWQPEKITESLTMLSDPNDEKAALVAFEDIMRAMGDKPTMFVGNKELPILNSLKQKEIVDEVYLQVVKQLTCNPSSTNSAAGWKLLKTMFESTPPSRELAEFLYCWCQEFADPEAAAKSHEETGAANMMRAKSTVGKRRSSAGMSKTRTLTTGGGNSSASDRLFERTRRRTEATVKADKALKFKFHERLTAAAKEVLDIIEELPMGKEISKVSKVSKQQR